MIIIIIIIITIKKVKPILSVDFITLILMSTLTWTRVDFYCRVIFTRARA